MRIAIVFLVAFAAPALAHGGSFGEPRGGVPPGLANPPPPGPPRPALACDCARIDCPHCSAQDLAHGIRLADRTVRFSRFQLWNDFAVVRCTASFRAKKNKRPIEAYAALAPSALFAPLGGSILQRGQALASLRVDSREGRRKYLWAKSHGLDPFLLLRETPGRYALRAFPVRAGKDTVVTVEGFALAPPRVRGAPRVYRTGDLVVVVRDLAAGEKPKAGEFHDTVHARAVRFVAAAGASGLERAVDVPFAPDLRRAVQGDDTVLVALPPNAAMPPENGDATPPGDHEPTEPDPPPPPSDPAAP